MITQIICKINKGLLIILSLGLRTPFVLVTLSPLFEHPFRRPHGLPRLFNDQLAFTPTAPHRKLPVRIVLKFRPVLEAVSKKCLMLHLAVGMSIHRFPGKHQSIAFKVESPISTLLKLRELNFTRFGLRG